MGSKVEGLERAHCAEVGRLDGQTSGQRRLRAGLTACTSSANPPEVRGSP